MAVTIRRGIVQRLVCRFPKPEIVVRFHVPLPNISIIVFTVATNIRIWYYRYMEKVVVKEIKFVKPQRKATISLIKSLTPALKVLSSK